MIVAVDETGDANLGTRTPKFAVGAIYLSDEAEAANVIESARKQIGADQHIFHFSQDGSEAQRALAGALDQSPLEFHLRVVAYEGEIPHGHTKLKQSDVHSQLLGHALGLLLFIPTNRILLSARQASLHAKNLHNAINGIQRSGEWLAVNFPELRRNPRELEERIQLVNGTDDPALQICDHILARWQASVRDSVSWQLPRKSIAISATRIRQYYTIAQCFRGGLSAMDLATNYSLERAAEGAEMLPLFAAYTGLLSVPEQAWCPQDRELIRLLLNEDESKLYESNEKIAHLCYLVLEGRTRWPKRVLLIEQSFELFRALASAFLHGTQDKLDMDTVAFDAVRFQIKDFRTALRKAQAKCDAAHDSADG